MNKKQAHQRKSRFSYYNRHTSTQWAEDYTAEQLKWLFDNKHIEYEGELYSLTSFATKMVQSKHSVAGPMYFKYKGEWLNEIRDRLGV